jgi:hypothetical protein
LIFVEHGVFVKGTVSHGYQRKAKILLFPTRTIPFCVIYSLAECIVLYPLYPAEIVAQHGFVRRARSCYLYTQRGKRYTDMYQEAGRAILGWEGAAARTIFKNVLNRGASGSFASEEAFRLEKAVMKLFPEVSFVRWYSGEKANGLMLRVSKSYRTSPAGWPLLHPGYYLWRPWSGDIPRFVGDFELQEVQGPESCLEEPVKAVLFLPPFPLAHDVIIFAALKDGGLSEDKTLSSDFLSPCLLAGITRSIHDLIAELPKKGEADWSVHDTVLLRFWNRKGPYLYPKMPQEEYAAFAQTCLEAGLVISPDYDIPSIVPAKANKGDFSTLCSKMK